MSGCNIAGLIVIVELIILIIKMKKTVRDLEKMSGKGVGYLKTGLYYLFVPLVIGMGLRTVDLSRFIQQPAL